MRQFRQEREYEAIRRCVQEQGYPVEAACLTLHVSRAGYYRWRSGRVSIQSAENRRIAGMVKEIHTQSPDKGYRRIRDDLERYFDTPVNDKRVLRICRSLGIKSTIKYACHGCTKRASDPQHTAENLLGRQFHADRPNEKWLTDVTEFKYYVGPVLHKIYLSAILDLCSGVRYVRSGSDSKPGSTFPLSQRQRNPIHNTGIPQQTGGGRHGPEHVAHR